MPQAELMTNEILILIGIPFGLLFSDLSSDGGVDDSDNDYIELFLEFAYQTDKLCFSLDIMLQRLFAVIVGFTLLNKLNSCSNYLILMSGSTKNDFSWLDSSFYSIFQFYYMEHLDDIWDVNV